MAHAQKPDFVFRAKRANPFKSAGGRQFSRLLAAEVCASAVVMLDTTRSEVVWRVLASHSIRHFPLHFPSRVLPCAITFQVDSTSCMQSSPRDGAVTKPEEAVAIERASKLCRIPWRHTSRVSKINNLCSDVRPTGRWGTRRPRTAQQVDRTSDVRQTMWPRGKKNCDY